MVPAPVSGIQWRIPVKLLSQQSTFKSKIYEQRHLQWQFIIKSLDESFSVAIQCVSTSTCPFVDFEMKIVNKRRLGFISKRKYFFVCNMVC